MSSSVSVLSETLQSITSAKLEELSKRRAVFEDQKAVVLHASELEPDVLKKLRILVDGVKTCFGVKTATRKLKDGHIDSGRIIKGSTRDPRLEVKLRNLERFLEQACYDPSISAKLMQDWKDSLMHLLDVQSLKYQYASLSGELVTEWLSADKAAAPSSSHDSNLTEGYEEIATKERLQSRAEWERSAFEAFDTDSEAIFAYLKTLFGETGSNKQAFKALEALRDNISSLETKLA